MDLGKKVLSTFLVGGLAGSVMANSLTDNPLVGFIKGAVKFPFRVAKAIVVEPMKGAENGTKTVPVVGTVLGAASGIGRGAIYGAVDGIEGWVCDTTGNSIPIMEYGKAVNYIEENPALKYACTIAGSAAVGGIIGHNHIDIKELDVGSGYDQLDEGLGWGTAVGVVGGACEYYGEQQP